MATINRVRLNERRCIGCGLCEENMPEVFTMGEYVASVRVELVPDSASDQLEVAARDCPVNAITVLPESRNSSDHHDEKGKNEKQYG